MGTRNTQYTVEVSPAVGNHFGAHPEPKTQPLTKGKQGLRDVSHAKHIIISH